MEIIVNVSLRKAPGQRAIPVDDIQVRDVFAKMPDEVESEISDAMSLIVSKAYVSLGEVDSLGDMDE